VTRVVKENGRLMRDGRQCHTGSELPCGASGKQETAVAVALPAGPVRGAFGRVVVSAGSPSVTISGDVHRPARIAEVNDDAAPRTAVVGRIAGTPHVGVVERPSPRMRVAVKRDCAPAVGTVAVGTRRCCGCCQGGENDCHGANRSKE